MVISGQRNKEKFEVSLKLLAKTSLIVFIGVFLSKVLAYAYRIIIARYYGPEAYGLFSLVILILGWIIAIATLGLTDGLLRFMPQYRAKKQINELAYLLRLTNKILLITSLFSAVLLFFLANFIALTIFHNSELILLLKLLSFFVPIAVLSGSFLVSLRAYEMISSYSLVYNIFQNVIRVLVLILLIILGLSTSSTVVSYGLGFLGVLVISYLICRYKLPELFMRPKLTNNAKLKIRKSFFSYSLPLLFFGIVSMLFYWADSIFLGYFKGAESVGFYNAAVPIALILAITPELFMQLFFPLINRYYSNKKFELIRQLSKQLGKWVFMINFPIFVLIFIFPGAAINILFGAQYLVAENALRLLIFGSFFASVAVISNNLLSMSGRSKLILADIILASVLNVILNIILIPMPLILGMNNALGINGAAIATAISIIFLNLLFLIQTKKYLGILPVRAKMINIVILGLILTVVLSSLRMFFHSLNLLVILLLSLGFLIAYILLMLISKSLDESDWVIVSSIFKKIKSTFNN